MKWQRISCESYSKTIPTSPQFQLDHVPFVRFFNSRARRSRGPSNKRMLGWSGAPCFTISACDSVFVSVRHVFFVEFYAITLWLCQHNYWKLPIEIVDLPRKKVISHSDVGLPEGNNLSRITNLAGDWGDLSSSFAQTWLQFSPIPTHPRGYIFLTGHSTLQYSVGMPLIDLFYPHPRDSHHWVRVLMGH